MTRIIAASVALVSCSGSWSNDSLEFGTAVPRRALFQVPAGFATATVTPPETPTIDRTSTFAADVVRASKSYNDVLSVLMGSLDVTGLDATTQTADSRTWGPYPDTEHPSSTFWLTATRDAGGTNYTWELDVQVGGASKIVVGTGSWARTNSVAYGSGVMQFDLSGLQGAWPDVSATVGADNVAITYNITPSLFTASMAFPDAGSPTLSASGYQYQVTSDAGVRLSFRTADGGTAYDAAWISSGVGIARTTDAGTSPGVTECWDETFALTFRSAPGAAPLGREKDCPSL